MQTESELNYHARKRLRNLIDDCLLRKKLRRVVRLERDVKPVNVIMHGVSG